MNFITQAVRELTSKMLVRLFYPLFIVCFTITCHAGDLSAKVVVHWVPQAQFAGYYVARDAGIYKKHGLDVKILPGGPNVSVSDCMKSGKADFGTTFLLNATKLHARGLPMVNIAQISRRSALMLVAKKSSGIREHRDMNGKKNRYLQRRFQ